MSRILSLYMNSNRLVGPPPTTERIGSGSSEWSGISRYTSLQDAVEAYPTRSFVPSPRSGSQSPRTPIIHNPSSEEVVRANLRTLDEFLVSHNIDKQASIRDTKANQKLSQLSGSLFFELCADVTDEVRRRQTDPSSTCLREQQDFHPKRNEGRRKLSSLSRTRFCSLVGDVYAECNRRVFHSGTSGSTSNNPTQMTVQQEIITPNLPRF